MSDTEDDPYWAASLYRSEYCRKVRPETNALDFSTLGPTQANALPWSPHLSAILCAVLDPCSPLHMFKGQEASVIKKIYQFLVETWREHIVICPPSHSVATAVADLPWDDGATEEDYKDHNHALIYHTRFHNPGSSFQKEFVKRLGISDEHRPEVAFSLLGSVEFPPPKDINVNMLPFVMGDACTLPSNLRPYYESIIAKCPIQDDEYGKVVYLTVSEGMVEASATQRRAGLHVEAASGIGGVGGSFKAGTESNWGGGVRDYFDTCVGDEEDGMHDTYDGGLYMASNMDNTCMLWDALIAKDQGLADYHGGMDHLRPFIGQGTALKANELAWLTDRTPHEALSQSVTGYRQFFRLVTSNISVWFKHHSTENPKVPVPDYVQIIDDNKFATSFTGRSASKTKTRKIDTAVDSCP